MLNTYDAKSNATKLLKSATETNNNNKLLHKQASKTNKNIENTQKAHKNEKTERKTRTANSITESLRDQHIIYAHNNRKCARIQQYNLCISNCPCAVNLTHACAKK